jgi:hypothetical protein
MSDKNQEKNTSKNGAGAAAAKDGAGKEKAGNIVKAKEAQKQEIKVEWTLERCLKYARRYPNEAVWASDSPASYKSAVAHGWKDQCVAAMKTGGADKVVHAKFPTRPVQGVPTKKAA